MLRTKKTYTTHTITTPHFFIIITLILIILSSFISLVETTACVDYQSATEVAEGQTTVADTTCTANAAPFPASVVIGGGDIITDNLQLFYIPQQTLTSTYDLTVDTCASTFDTKMVLFVHNTVNDTYEYKTASDDACGLQSSITATISDVEEAYIGVSGVDASTAGKLILTIQMSMSNITQVELIRFISQDIENIASMIAAINSAITSDTSLTTMQTNIDSINTIKSNILTEYDTNGIVSDMTAYVTALQSTLSQLATDVAALQTNIANRVTADTTNYNSAVSDINTAIGTVTDQAGNISTSLSSTQTGISNVDDEITTISGDVAPKITVFTDLNTFVSSQLLSIEDEKFTLFATKFLTHKITSDVPPILMSPLVYNGKIESVHSIVVAMIADQPPGAPDCSSFMTLYDNDYGNGLFISAFTDLQSAYQCIYGY